MTAPSILRTMPPNVMQKINGLTFGRHPNIDKDVDDFEARARSRYERLISWTPPTTTFLIDAFGKSGTHWLWEIMMMLERQSTDSIPYHKEYAFLEMVSIDDIPADCKVYNTHTLPSVLPPNLKEIKTVYILRNIKDVLISSYHHMKSMPKMFKMNVPELENLAFETHFNNVILDNRGANCEWFEFTKQAWDNRNKPNCLLLFYEDLIVNFHDSVRQLAEFMKVSVSDEFLEDIQKNTVLKSMKEKKQELCGPKDDIFLTLFRKGGVGGWKNYFTVAQNEIAEKIYKEVMEGYEDIPFTYTQ